MKAVFKTTSAAGTTSATDSSTGSGSGASKEPSKESLSFATGDYIFREGELGTEMFIIQDGEVHICKTLKGETHVLSRLEKGDFFGEMAILESVPRSADAIAHSDVKVIAITGSRFDEMLRRNPEIAVRIIRKYSKRLREANDLLEKIAGKEIDPEHAFAQAAAPVTRVARENVHRYRVVDVATGDAFFLSDADETLIGRSDPVTGIMPDIDLTPVDTNRSVSRRHAKIVRQGDGYAVLEEVGTVNGTFVNDQRIPTGVPVPIVNGDQLKIGLISMRVVFEQ
jgi:CRP-like cAMP-binding protein